MTLTQEMWLTVVRLGKNGDLLLNNFLAEPSMCTLEFDLVKVLDLYINDVIFPRPDFNPDFELGPVLRRRIFNTNPRTVSG